MNEPYEAVKSTSPSNQIHERLLDLRDSLDSVSCRMTEKLLPVTNDYPVLPETKGEFIESTLPPLFRQYNELIDHIELVVLDINIKLDNVSI